MQYRSQWPTFILRSSIKSYWLIIPWYHVNTSNSLKDIRQNHWTMKYRSQWPTFILTSSIKSYWLIIPRYHINTSNSLQDIRQNHWTIKYRSQWPTLILRSSIKSYWLIIPRFHVNTSNKLVGHLTRKSGVLGSIPGLATYFRFSFRFFKKGSCQLLGKVCARSTG